MMEDIHFKSFDCFMDFHMLQIIHGIFYPFILFFGIPFGIGFTCYEHFGGDPLKRSLENQFFSQMVWCLILFLFPGCFGIFWRIYFGSLHEQIAMFFLAVRQFSELIGYLYITETMVHRYIKVCS